MSPPRVVYKEEGGKRLEPLEEVICEVDDEQMGSVIEVLQHVMLRPVQSGHYIGTSMSHAMARLRGKQAQLTQKVGSSAWERCLTERYASAGLGTEESRA